MYDACENSTQPGANAASAYHSWTAAGFPASKIVIGLPSYGYVSSSKAASLRTRSNSVFASPRLRRSPDDVPAQQESNVRVVDEDGGSDGTVQFRDLIKQGTLVYSTSGANPELVPAGGFVRYWDDCSSTPFLRSNATDQVISYDDPESLGMKAKFAKSVGMMGTNMFDVHGDTDDWILTDSVRKNLGLYS